MSGHPRSHCPNRQQSARTQRQLRPSSSQVASTQVNPTSQVQVSTTSTGQPAQETRNIVSCMTRLTDSCITESPPHYSLEEQLDNSTPRRESLQPNPTYAAIAQGEPSGKDTWFLDSCCGQHMCSSGRFVQREHLLQREVVITVANNQNLRTRRQGVVQIQSRETNVILQMSKVLIAEGLGYNLLSVSQLMAKGIHLEADSTTQELKLYHGKGGLYIGKAVLKNNVFVLDFVPDLGTTDSDGIVNFTSWTHPPDLDPDFSPEGFCRNNIGSSRNIGNTNNTYNTGRKFFNDIATHRQYFPDPCTAANSHSSRSSQKRQLHRRLLLQLRSVSSAPAYAPLEKVYSDILYNREPGQGAYSYTITFIDAATRYVWHLNLPSKDMAFEAFIAWLPVAERELGEKLKSFQSDGGGEYTSQRFKQFLAEKGIKRLISLPYAHQQQGVAERMNRTLQNTMRKLLRGMRLPNHQRPESMDHAVMLHNLLSSSSLPNNASPHLLWTGKQGSTKLLRVFGCMNVDNASDEAGPLPYCSVPIPMDDENPRESINAETYFDLADTGYVTPAEVNTNEAERVGPNFIPDPEAGDEAAYPEDTTLPRYTQSGLQILGLVTAVHGLDPPEEPATVQQALGGEHKEKWREAMDKELKALQERNTWKVVPIGVAQNKTILTGKWVFRVKTKADGTIDKFKARWVVRGFDQEHGRDFTETFAPVSRHTSLQILLAVAAMKKKKLRQIDIANAFLYAPVDAEIYVELPHGSHGEPNQVCQLQKSLYGIKQAPRLWQQYLHTRLTRIGFKQLPHDQGMYRFTKDDDYILLIVYVDDLLYIGSTDNVTTWFEGELQKDLTLTVSSTVTQYLGLNIQEEDTIYLNAAKYADTIAKRFALTPTTISTPYRYTVKKQECKEEGGVALAAMRIQIANPRRVVLAIEHPTTG
ncbi:unnamed protein product [Closterium sp. NIES-54]